MARNQYAGPCYQCGVTVLPGTGHFEKHGSGWRVKHANVPGHGRVTCSEAEDAMLVAQEASYDGRKDFNPGHEADRQ